MPAGACMPSQYISPDQSVFTLTFKEWLGMCSELNNASLRHLQPLQACLGHWLRVRVAHADDSFEKAVILVHAKIFAAFRLWAKHVGLALADHIVVRRPGMSLMGPSNPLEVCACICACTCGRDGEEGRW